LYPAERKKLAESETCLLDGKDYRIYNERLSKLTSLAHTKFWEVQQPLEEIPSSNNLIPSKPDLEQKSK
jgi:hypothetical protein